MFIPVLEAVCGASSLSQLHSVTPGLKPRFREWNTPPRCFKCGSERQVNFTGEFLKQALNV